MAIFDKYAELMGPRPNGRPVGVPDGFGQQTAQVLNPVLNGMPNAGSMVASPAAMDWTRNSGSGALVGPTPGGGGGGLINGHTRVQRSSPSSRMQFIGQISMARRMSSSSRASAGC